jgi:drug/metabolite transporter (DMT)-like permease
MVNSFKWNRHAGHIPHTVNRTDSETQRLGVGLGLGAATGLGLAIAVSRFAYDGGTDGLTLSATRTSLMALGVLLFCRLTGRRLHMARADALNCAGLGVLTALMFYGNVGSVEYIRVGLAALLFFTYPPMIVVLNVLVVREQVTSIKLGCLLSAFFGLSLMLGVSFISVDVRGVGLSLMAAVSCAWHAIWLSRRTRHLDPLVVTAYMAVVAALVLLGLNLATGGFDWPRSVSGWAGFAGVVLLQGSSVPVYIVSIGIIGALKSGMITNLQPVVSIVAAFVLYGETLTPVQLAGGIMVLAAVWVMQWSDARALAARI